MRHTARLAAGLALAAAFAAPSAAADVPTPPGFKALFNGKDLTGWKGHTTPTERKLPPEKLAELQQQRDALVPQQWSVVDGAIHLTPPKKGPGVSLATDKDYANFELLLDWKIEKGGDSGVYVRGQPQIQIWDSDNLAPSLKADFGTGSGGLWNNPVPKGADPKSVGKVPLKKADKPVGEWNTFRVIAQGDTVTVYLNGELVVDKAKLPNYWERGQPVPAAGSIELQYHGDRLWFRNIFIKELP